MNENLIDNCFYVKYKKYGTWCSYDTEDKSLVTSLTEEQCIASTRWFLQFLHRNDHRLPHRGAHRACRTERPWWEDRRTAQGT